jgi:hypothetical protein
MLVRILYRGYFIIHFQSGFIESKTTAINQILHDAINAAIGTRFTPEKP